MKVEIKVPSFGESVVQVTVAQVFKKSGQYVKKDEEILELESDKVNAPLLSPEAGVLQLTVKEQDTLSIGSIVGSVDTSAAQPVEEVKKEELKKESSKQEAVEKPVEVISKQTSYPKVRITPDEFLASLGKPRIKEQPVAQEPSKPLSVQRKKMSSLRKTIATKLVQVKNETAMLTTFNEIDMSAVMKIRSDQKDDFFEKHGVKLGFMSFFVKACVSALQHYPDVNAYIDGDEIVYFSSCDIGVAVSTDKGLMVPIVRNCENKTFAEIEKAIADYSKKARDGKLTMNDLKGGSFTITNGGVFGSLLSTPILNPPQSAILGMHTIKERPCAVDKEVVIRPMMYLALSYDHRIIDGKEAVGFLVHVKEHLEDPAKLLLNF